MGESKMYTEDVIAMLNDLKFTLMHRYDIAKRIKPPKNYQDGIADSIKQIDHKINLISNGGTKESITGNF